MSDYKILLLVFGPAILVACVATLCVFAEGFSDRSETFANIILAVVLTLGAACIGIECVYNCYVAVALLLVVFLSTFSFVSPLLASTAKDFGSWIRKGQGLLGIIVFGIIVYVGYFHVRPFLATPILPQFLTPEASLAEAERVKQRIDDMRQVLQNAQTSLQVQTQQVNSAVTALSQTINNKNDEVQKLENELSTMRSDIENYKRVANISREDAESLAKLLKGNEWRERATGFGIGVASSLTAAIFLWLGGRVSSRRQSKESRGTNWS